MTTLVQRTFRKGELENQMLLDPVSKFRVSTPQTLIDTDFEYGLQSTKWETIELANNIPTFFSRTGDDPVSVTNVTSVSGSYNITVVTTSAHNINVGTPIIIYGLTSITAEGSFTVLSVIDAVTFVYKAKAKQLYTGSIFDTYNTYLYPARVFQSTQYRYDDIISIETDNQLPSKLTVNTVNPHGFAVGSSMILANSVGRKSLAFDGSLVDPLDILSTNYDIATSSSNPSGTNYTSRAIVPYDWQSKKTVFFNSTAVSTSTSFINAVGHGLATGDSVMYVSPVGDTTVGNLTNYNLYNVVKVDNDNLYLTMINPTMTSGIFWRIVSGYYNENPGYFEIVNVGYVGYTTGSVTDISSIKHIFGAGYNLTSNDNYSVEYFGYFLAPATGTWTFYTSSDDASYLWIGDVALSGYTTANAVVKNGGIHGVQEASGTISLTANTFYPIRIQFGESGGGDNLIVSFAGPGVAKTTNGTGYYFTEAPNYTTSASKLTLTSQGTSTFGPHALMKAYLVNSVNAATAALTISLNSTNGTGASLADNDPILMFSYYTNRKNFAVPPMIGSYDNISRTNYTKYYVRGNPSIGGTTSTIQVSTAQNGSVIDFRLSNVFGLTWIIPAYVLQEADSFYYSNHGLTTDQAVTYTVLSGTGPTGLTPSSTYYVEKISEALFRLKVGTGAASTVDITTVGNGSIRFNRTIPNPNANTIYIPNHDIINYTQVTYKRNTNTAIAGLTDGATYYVVNATADRFQLASSITPVTVVDITAAGTGITHEIVSIDRAIDGNYKIVSVPNERSFLLDSDFKMPYNEIALDPRKNLVLYTSTIYYPNHRLTTGGKLLYSANGNSVISGLNDATNYYAIRVDTNHFKLATTYANAIAGTAISLSSYGTGSLHYIYGVAVAGEVVLSSAIATTNGSAIVTSETIDLLALSRVGDVTLIEIPNIVSSFTITTVDTTNDVLTLSAVHGLIDGDLIHYQSTTITGPSTGQYYVRVTGLTTSQISLFNTYAGATGNTGKVDITAFTSATGNVYKIATTFTITAIDALNDILTLSAVHGFADGDYIYYTGATVTGLTSGYVYYVRVTGLTTSQVSLYNTRSDATGGISKVDITGGTASGTISKRLPASIYQSTIVATNASKTLTLSSNASTTCAAARWIARTSMFPRVDGYTQHRPFDGGVEIIPSSSPDCQIIRQTRKYFRYQSGKGIQVSKAVNFNAPTDINQLYRVGTTAYVQTRKPHRLTTGATIRIRDASQPEWNNTFTIVSVPDVNIFTFTLTNVPTDIVAGGYPQYYVQDWINSCLRAGLFDDQNGLFYEYDGTTLYAVRRNSVQQVPGSCTVTFNNPLVVGTNTRYTTQLLVGDRVVIRGMTYKVVQVTNDTNIYVQPPYRGATATNAIMTKTIDTKVAQANWSIDKCDGTGPTGFNLDINKIQMIYIDYSWYGAGKVRFGFKAANGEVRYVHEFLHNNNFTEAYLRSGNLPGRYEVATVGIPTYVPPLMHWGTSIIMDGRFDDDKAYLFTAAGNTISYANGDTATFTANTNIGQSAYVLVPGTSTYGYRITATTYTSVQNIKSGFLITGAGIATNTYTIGNPVKNGTAGYIYLTNNLVSGGSANATLTAGDTNDTLPALIPLASIRLAPSVDNSRPGALGTREIINRMQLALKSIGILTTHDVEIKLLLNGYPFNKSWQRVTNPSLSQLLLHTKGDVVSGGTQIYTFRVSGGAADAAGKRSSNNITTSLDELTNLGNSIIGGDDVFPNGPDLLTIGATVIDTSGITLSTPFTIAGRVTWTESQA
jgi:hypothetical protein